MGETKQGPVNEPGRVSAGVRLWARLSRSAGQTTTEWLMIAGTLTAVALFFGQVIPPALRAFVRSLAFSIRTVAP
ncbi:MAG: hypothetical protein KJ066_16990 [Acidobacteria bacterium]|nr:hypothetical protein [Acidobacteriota bacterium]